MALQQSHYEINVSYNGKHFFATAERSATTEHQARDLYKALQAAFPAVMGYEVTCLRIECIGKQVNF